MKLYKQHPILRALPTPAEDATMADVAAYLAERGLVAVPVKASDAMVGSAIKELGPMSTSYTLVYKAMIKAAGEQQ